jgi:YVTN family beta-propeller protein
MKPANVTGYAGLTRMICPRLAIALLALGAVPTSLTSSLAQLPTNTVVATIPVGSGPGWTVVSPDSSTVYVINDTDGTVSVINASTNTVTSVITVGSLPAQGGISPDGKTLYVLNEAADNVAIISTASNTVTGTFKIGKHGDGLAVSPDGKELYLGRAYVFRNGKGTIKSVDTTTNKITSTVVLGALDPLTVLFRPDGSSAYISAANEFGKTIVSPRN